MKILQFAIITGNFVFTSWRLLKLSCKDYISLTVKRCEITVKTQQYPDFFESRQSDKKNIF